jgi:hypothetical protein
MEAHVFADILTVLRSSEVTQPCASTGGYRVTPNSPEQAMHLLALAHQAQHPLYFSLDQARLHKTPTWVDVCRLNHVLAYNPADLTITVQTGITTGDLATVLSEQGQCFPLIYPPETSLLDVLMADRPAVNSGLALAQRGYPRDWVLGLTIVSGDGVLSHCGGQVVKNVTGYDLCKLVVGSQCQLGLLTTATLRLMPKPAEQTMEAWGFTSATEALLASEALLQQSETLGLSLCEVFYQSRLTPALQDTLSQAHPGLSDWVLLQAERSAEALTGGTRPAVMYGLETTIERTDWLRALSGFDLITTPLVLEVALPHGHWASHVQHALDLVQPLCQQLDTPLYPGCRLVVQGRPAMGLLYLAWQGPNVPHSQQVWGQPAQWTEGLAPLQAWLHTLGGQLACLQAPPCLPPLLEALHPSQQYPPALTALHHAITSAYQQPLPVSVSLIPEKAA